MKTKAPLLIATILLATAFAMHSQVTQLEFDALKALYNSTDGDNWTNNANWDTTATAVDVNSTWYGLTISAGNVTSINLNTNNLIGALPVEIGSFPNLTALYLYNNQISGSIPQEIGNLNNLEGINFSNNLLDGIVTSTIGNLNSLKYLSLNSNEFSGNFPSISNLIDLIAINIDNNNFSGSILDQICTLNNLVYIYLKNNNLNGNLPTNIGSLGKLEVIHLTNNNFTGSIPSNIGNLANLIEVRFNINEFSGSIPEGLGNISSLDQLDISSNQYTFEELEPVMDTLPAFTQYAPQDSLQVAQEVYNLVEGDALNLSLTTGGDNNLYKWYRDVASVSDETASPGFSIAEVALSDAGTYVCRVTNTTVPSLQLYSNPITVTVAEDPTGINDKANNNKISIHPNPTNGPITIKANNIQKISIQNMAGQTVLSQQASGEEEVLVDAGKLGSGIYVVVVETEGGMYREKLIIKN